MANQVSSRPPPRSPQCWEAQRLRSFPPYQRIRRRPAQASPVCARSRGAALGSRARRARACRSDVCRDGRARWPGRRRWRGRGGRGSVAGPLTVCAVCLPERPRIWGLNDSKKLTPARRERLAEEIAQVAVAIGFCHIPAAKSIASAWRRRCAVPLQAPSPIPGLRPTAC